MGGHVAFDGDILKMIDGTGGDARKRVRIEPLNANHEYSCKRSGGGFEVRSDYEAESFDIPRVRLTAPDGVMCMCVRSGSDIVRMLADPVSRHDDGSCVYDVDLGPGGTMLYFADLADVDVDVD